MTNCTYRDGKGARTVPTVGRCFYRTVVSLAKTGVGYLK